MAWTIPFFNMDVLNLFFVLGPLLCAGHREIDQHQITYGRYSIITTQLKITTLSGNLRIHT